MNLQFGITFEDLYEPTGLKKLDDKFLSFLAESDATLNGKLLEARKSKTEDSDLIIELAPILELFVAKLFVLEGEVNFLTEQTRKLDDLYKCKRLFVQRKAAKKYKADEVYTFAIEQIEQEILSKIPEITELSFSNYVVQNLDNEEVLEPFLKYAAWALNSEAGRVKYRHSVLFQNPQKLNFDNLLHLDDAENLCFSKDRQRNREGFDFTDEGVTLKKALSEANYCIICHERDKDSCSKGLKDKEGSFKKSTHDITLTGCPLEEKISEMNLLRTKGNVLGSLAAAMIDNPLLAATGNRICNDCMKGCIYQLQEPVNIPQVETETLEQVLQLPYGFEIYSLLTRWNPLNVKRPLQQEESGYKVLVVGQGPAGFNLAYHLTQEGHFVVAIDGLKIEPLDIEFKPIKKVEDFTSKLSERIPYGFGGVAEYGITVRWNKNYLSIIRLILERNQNYKLYGGVRFGSQITKEIAFDELGFDHIALCMGAGSPNIISLKNNLSRGVRKASDFLMNLQLSGAFKKNSLANLQIRLPVIVIGGGLTAIDTATESLAYYPVQVEKFLSDYELLCKKDGRDKVESKWDAEEKQLAAEFISHAKALRAEKSKENPDIVGLLESWGGVKILYRKRLQDSPAYRLNHEEVEKAFEEGINFVPETSPSEVLLDEYQSAKALKAKCKDAEKIFPARTILVAAGTKPNTVLAREDKDIELDNLYFRAIDEQGNKVVVEACAKPEQVEVITYRNKAGKAISFFGDMHPSFSGNVVKAMASAKKGYPVISRELSKLSPALTSDFEEKLDRDLKAEIVEVKRLTPTIIEVVVKAPLACCNFKPGQFYRLQNFEVLAERKEGKVLAQEGIALTGASANPETGNISLITLEMGGSSNICKNLKPGEPVTLMGPTGTPTEIMSNKTILLAGGGLGNAVLFSIGKAYRNAGSKVLYFAGYKKAQDRYKIAEIEAASDVVIWACDEDSDFATGRPDDKVFKGNIIEAMQAYASGKLGEQAISFKAVDHIIAIGSDRMMQAVKEAKHGVLKEYLASPSAVASINSPMQCMMKEICAQCLQRHIDPKTGEEYFVYSCFNQDQNIEEVDFEHLRQRLRQNSLQEKLTKQVIAHIS